MESDALLKLFVRPEKLPGIEQTLSHGPMGVQAQAYLWLLGSQIKELLCQFHSRPVLGPHRPHRPEPPEGRKELGSFSKLLTQCIGPAVGLFYLGGGI